MRQESRSRFFSARLVWLVSAAAAVCIGIAAIVFFTSPGRPVTPQSANAANANDPSAAAPSAASGSPSPSVSASPQPSASAKPAPSRSPNSGGTRALNCIPSPHSCGFPDATNTGVPAGHNLTRINGDYTVTKPGTYSNLHVTGIVYVKADYVTLRYLRVECNNAGSSSCVIFYKSHDSLLDSEIGGGADGHSFTRVGSAIYSGGGQGTGNLIQRVNIHHADDGFRPDGGTIMRDNYVHHLSNGLNGSHSDNSQSCQGTYITFIHNTFLGGNNDPIFLQGGDCGSNDALYLDHVLVDNNLLVCAHEYQNVSGYGVSIGRARNVTIVNNHFDRGWQVTPIGVYRSNSMVTDQSSLTLSAASNWSQGNNVFDDNGAPVPFPGN